MFRLLLKNLRQLSAAVLLLCFTAVVAEVWLQLTEQGGADTGVRCRRFAPTPLIVPSTTAHHELRRLSEYRTAAGRTAPIRINSLGMRGDEPAARPAADVLRILILGDDTVFGAALPEQQTLSALVAELVRKNSAADAEVINGGVPGDCPLLSILRFRNEWSRLQPDIVVLHVDMSDVADDALYRTSLKEEHGSSVCPNPLLETPHSECHPLVRLVRKSALCRKLTENLCETQNGSALPDASRRNCYAWTLQHTGNLQLQVRHALEPIIRLQKLAEQDGFRLMISVSPVPWQLTQPESADTPQTPMRLLSMLSGQLQTAFCDAQPAFRSFSAPEKLYVGDTPELSRYGTALYARELTRCLLQSPQTAALFQSTDGSRTAGGRELRLKNAALTR